MNGVYFMLRLHVVQEGDTVDSIAKQYNISVKRIMEDNLLSPGDTLNIGQVIAIVYPEQTYIVKEGDTLYDIAEKNGVSVMELMRNNPILSDRSLLEVGEELILRYDNKENKIRVNGMTYSFIDDQILRKTLPFLTYITVMGYRIDINGNINDIDDTRVIQMAYNYDVVQLMLIYSLNEAGQGNPAITHAIFNSMELQNNMLQNIIDKIKIKGYRGVVFGFQYVLAEDRQKYTDFIVSATQRLHEEGYLSAAVLIPDTFGYTQGNLMNQSYYSEIGNAVDGVILLSYQWSTSYIPQVYQTAYSYLRDYVEYAIKQIPPEKIYLGLSRIAYNWELPYVEGESFVSSLTNPGALELANQYGSEIYFDEATQFSYFEYNETGTNHVVWFKDARHTIAILNLIIEYGLGGISVWTIMYYFQVWLIINSQYDIEKVLPVLPEQ